VFEQSGDILVSSFTLNMYGAIWTIIEQHRTEDDDGADE